MPFVEGIKQSLIYPFEDRDWVSKLWPLPLIAAIPVLVPIFTVCAYYITTAHELGLLARKLINAKTTSEIASTAA
ncbi:hypothetical protein EUZ85_16910 [Hahella sp. KA22]|uniref:hypothetical protein n=1 Tax=Hahella sp. KA22 TaxID=1628392 RepID=UPI000FDEB5C1|nr:hypothetical protein [Hahella sp. KA22]AZZ92316.1 hypothetical protein ENC22_14340 [Hahella sp. KA22]QAY55688.1 hypothetical protein EUZ85_16910 [Hahella sp. KA22]